jgi:hypothetical protein
VTTTSWIIFGVVMPAIVAGLGTLLAWLQMRSLRREDARRGKPAE